MRYENLRLTVAGVAYGVTVTARPTTPTAYAPVTVQWQTSTGLDQPDPATMTVDVSVPAGHPWPALGDVVALRADADPYYDLEIFDGVVDAMRRRRRTLWQPDGSTFEADVLRLTCIDWRGVAARRRVGDTPWPLENVADRIRRIMALAPELPRGYLYDAETLGGNVAPRDVDAVSVLDLLVDTVSGGDHVVTSAADGLSHDPRRSEGPFELTLSDTAPPVIAPSTATAIVPASVVEDADRVLDRDGLINSTALSYPVDPDDPTQNTWPETTATYSDPASVTVYGAAAYTSRCDNVAPYMRRTALQWAVTAGQPRWRLDGAIRLRVGDPDWPRSSYATVALVRGVDREGYPLVITGAPESDLETHRVIGATITLGDPDLESVQVVTEPWVIAAAGGLRFTAIHPDAGADLFADVTAADCAFISRTYYEQGDQ